MKKIKQKYVPCEVNVVEFKVEQGFAQSPMTTYGVFTNAVNTQNWQMNKTPNQGFRNKDAQYGSMDVNGWFE